MKKISSAVSLRISLGEWEGETFFLYTGLCAKIRFSLGLLTHHTKHKMTIHFYFFCAKNTADWLPREADCTAASLPTDWPTSCIRKMKGFSQVRGGCAYSRKGNAGSTVDLQKSSNFRREEEVGKRARSRHIRILIRNLVKTAYGRITQ